MLDACASRDGVSGGGRLVRSSRSDGRDLTHSPGERAAAARVGVTPPPPPRALPFFFLFFFSPPPHPAPPPPRHDTDCNDRCICSLRQRPTRYPRGTNSLLGLKKETPKNSVSLQGCRLISIGSIVNYGPHAAGARCCSPRRRSSVAYAPPPLVGGCVAGTVVKSKTSQQIGQCGVAGSQVAARRQSGSPKRETPCDPRIGEDCMPPTLKWRDPM